MQTPPTSPQRHQYHTHQILRNINVSQDTSPHCRRPKQNDVNANDEIGWKIHPAYGNTKGHHVLNSKAPRMREHERMEEENHIRTPALGEESPCANVQRRVTRIAGAAAGPFMTAHCEYNESENRHDLGPMTVGSYSVVIQSTHTLPTIEVYFQELTPVDYHAFGDIVWIIPLGSPENFDMLHHAIVHIAGFVTNVNEDNLTFEIHATQYVSATKTADNVFSGAIEVLLTGVKRNEDCTVNYFIVDLEKVMFLGPASVTPKAKESPTKLVNTSTPVCLKFTGFFGSQGSDRKSGEPNPKKHKTADDRANQEAEDKVSN
ncbi:hypothetical protein B0H17DRAFT_1205867 [Mycena rosella]|uniref:Uncharacterized protein n=1 Tax=Mycena rosella TaxID=1033263 RepID=A0AAD7D6C7_MYCRO|nr:hypothetical protein B0H17DRAFT_1205867 [Mycena rosella]